LILDCGNYNLHQAEPEAVISWMAASHLRSSRVHQLHHLTKRMPSFPRYWQVILYLYLVCVILFYCVLPARYPF
jgi:hypothetical protein